MKNSKLTYSIREVYRILKEKEHQNKDFYTNMDKLQAMIDAINQVSVIDHKVFKAIRILMRFFRFPVLILFRPLYQRIEADPGIAIEFDEDLKGTATIVKKIIKSDKFPSLEYYFNSGFDPHSVNEVRFPNDEERLPLCDTVQTIENILFKTTTSLQRELIQQIGAMVKALTGKMGIQIEKMCLNAYIELLKQKKLYLQRSIQPKPQAQYDKPRLPSQQKAETDEAEEVFVKGTSESLCCRTYFQLNQVLEEAETQILEYKNYPFPFPRHLEDILLKTIAGFLNYKGGIIYIGVKENTKTFRRTVVGSVYSEAAKEEVQKRIRQLGQRIAPDIVNRRLYDLEFVPIKDARGAYIEGKYILRLRIRPGSKSDLYCFRNNDDEEVFGFRAPNQVLCRRFGQEVLEIYRQRLANPPQRLEYINHPGPCKVPQLGKAFYSANIDKGSTYQKYPVRTMNYDVPKPQYRQKILYFFWGMEQECKMEEAFYKKLSNYKNIRKGGLLVVVPNSNSEFEDLQRFLIAFKKNPMNIGSTVLKLKGDEIFMEIKRRLEEEKILFSCNSRTQLDFNKAEEAIDAMICLRNMKYPFEFILREGQN